MFAIALMAAATFLEEGANTLGKRAVARRIESIYALGFLSLFWGSIVMVCSVLFFGADWHFSKASLPYFIPRMILEIIVATVSVKALITAERSSFAFIKLVTIPLLLDRK